MIKNKVMFSVLAVLILSIFVSGAAAVACSVTTEGAITTNDATPAVTFTPVGNNSSYLCTLWIDSVAYGTATVANNTEGSITCNTSLARGTYTYKVSMYNVSEVPATTYSSDANLRVTTFGSVVTMLSNLVGIFTPVLNIVVAVIPILIALAIATFVIGLMGSILGKIKGGI